MTDYTDLTKRLRRQADAFHPESLASRNAAEAAAAIKALQAEVARLRMISAARDAYDRGEPSQPPVTGKPPAALTAKE